MKFEIRHEIKGRMRVHMAQEQMSFVQADTLLYYIQKEKFVISAKVYERTADAVICYEGERGEVIRLLSGFCYDRTDVPAGVLENSGRELNAFYREKLIGAVLRHYARRLFVPAPIRAVLTTIRGIRYIWKGIQSLRSRKLDVAVLDATAIAVSLLRGDTGTAGSVMFLLGIGGILEEWTAKNPWATLPAACP